MSSPVWQLDAWRARLQIGAFRGQLNLLAPDKGLSLTSSDATNAATKLSILAVDLPPPSPGAENPPADCYVRGNDLVVVYAQAGPRPVRVEVYWRVDPSAAGVCLEHQVSVQTSLLESAPEIITHSTLPAAEVWRLKDVNTRVFERLAHSNAVSTSVRPEHGPGCLCFQLPGNDFSYGEMIHPSDFRGDELATLTDGGLSLRHRLFTGELEKGVILRGRVRATLLPRAGDHAALAEAFAAFCGSPPPLTT